MKNKNILEEITGDNVVIESLFEDGLITEIQAKQLNMIIPSAYKLQVDPDEISSINRMKTSNPNIHELITMRENIAHYPLLSTLLKTIACFELDHLISLLSEDKILNTNSYLQPLSKKKLRDLGNDFKKYQHDYLYGTVKNHYLIDLIYNALSKASCPKFLSEKPTITLEKIGSLNKEHSKYLKEFNRIREESVNSQTNSRDGVLYKSLKDVAQKLFKELSHIMENRSSGKLVNPRSFAKKYTTKIINSHFRQRYLSNIEFSSDSIIQLIESCN